MHTAKELGLSQVKVKRILAAYNDLKEQADFYGMEIDLETAGLVPKRNFAKPAWFERWIEKRNSMDLNELTDMERE